MNPFPIKKLSSLVLSASMTLLPLLSFADPLEYNASSKRLEIRNLCNPSFPNATLGIKATHEGREERIANNISANSQGCFSITLSDVSCDSIRVYVTDVSHSGQKFAELKCSSHTVPELPMADLQKVRNEADNKGRFYANKVAEAYNHGRANYAYNYILGIQRANETLSGSPSLMAAQDRGSQDGESNGAPVGANKGTTDGQYQGSEIGTSHVTQQYRSILASPVDAKWKATADATPPSYSGGSFNGGMMTDYSQSLERSTSSDISGLDSELQSAIRSRNLDFYKGISFFNVYFALSNFRSNYPDQAAYFDNLNKFGNADEARNLYDRVFSQSYSEVVDDKILRKIQAVNQSAFNDGFNAAKQALIEVAYGEGYNSGYNSAAIAAAKAAFAKSYDQSYKTSFEKRVQYLENHAEIENIVTSIVDSEGKEELVIGQPVTLLVKSITNIGRVGGTLDVELGQSIVAKATINVSGLSQVKDLKLENIATISPTAKLGQQPVSLCIGGACTNQSIELKWENQIKGLTKKGVTEKASAELSVFIRSVLIDEWKELYKANKGQGQSIYDKLVTNSQTGKGEYTLNPKSKLATFQTAVKSNLSVPGFKEKIKTLGEDYLRMKGAMVTTEVAAHSIVDGLSSAKVTDASGSLVELKYDKMTPEQKKEALASYQQQQNELQAWVNSSPVLVKQMDGCTAKTKNNSLVSCIGFMNEEESRVDNYRQWMLSNTLMKKFLAAIQQVK